jgi:hypothetical protein
MIMTREFFSFIGSATPAELFVRRDRLYEARRDLKKIKGASAYLAEVNGAIRAIDEELGGRAGVSAPRDSRPGR